MTRDDKLKALDAAITQIEKSYGKGSIMKLGDSGANMNIETVPTGALSLDLALGLGGVPKGRVIEIYGPESRAVYKSQRYGRGIKVWKGKEVCNRLPQSQVCQHGKYHCDSASGRIYRGV